MYEDIMPAEFERLRKEDERWQLLDVREDWEVETAAVDGTLRIPMNAVPARIDELDASRPVAVLCHSGVRSAKVAGFLAGAGFDTVRNIAGGIDAWAQTVDQDLPRY